MMQVKWVDAAQASVLVSAMKDCLLVPGSGKAVTSLLREWEVSELPFSCSSMILRTARNALRRSAVTSTRRGFGSSSATAVAENELGKYADMPAVAVHKGYKMVMSLSICRLPPV
ncbi:hypothetical protein FOZ63_031910 [Perkinsus olseni]|uniref:Uncharacterized protein n=1 Tax=Perkinsus olseni TaxID=32597 RepID=A0A7J6R7R6_PEROL|nr:hypothetical protein FOZ63_031910 [Perkinsus olseni]